jgi:hypothetical protein
LGRRDRSRKPAWLDRRLPHISLESVPERVIALPEQAVPVPVT